MSFIKTSLQIRRELYAELKRLATLKGSSITSLLEEVIREYLEKEKRASRKLESVRKN